MKKSIFTIIALVLVSGLALAGYLKTGGGAVVTATTTPQSVEVPNGDYVFTALVTVTGSERVFVMKNCSVSEFVLTNAIPVDAYPPVPLSGVPVSQTITNLVVATASGSSEVLIKFE